ncbi:MAG: hypothetical protein ACRDF4_03370, partial [Rhabdochlamydiaceae bacterium]
MTDITVSDTRVAQNPFGVIEILSHATPANLLEGMSLAGIVAVAGLSLSNRSFFISGQVLSASLISYFLAYFVSSWALRNQGLGNR